MSQVEKELLKLSELAPLPIDLSFLIGYITYALPHDKVPNFRPVLKQLISYMEDSLITSHNVLELLAVLKHKILKDNPEQLINSIQTYSGELICDNNYLRERYFEEKLIKQRQKQKQGLGIECSICTVEIDAQSICYLSCDHMYHTQCFKEYSKQQIGNKQFPLKCPTQHCGLQVSNEEIRQFLPKEMRQKYQEFIFQNYVEKHMEDTSWCPTPGCKAVFSFDQVLTEYRCPSCKKHYCLACKCEMHTGITCQDYQSMADMDEPDRKFLILVKGSKYKQCPNCKFWVEKNEGCDHMTCRCKYEFCYICGGKYGKCACVGGQQNDEQAEQQQQQAEVPYSEEDIPQIENSVVNRPPLIMMPMRPLRPLMSSQHIMPHEPILAPVLRYQKNPQRFEEKPLKQQRMQKIQHNLQMSRQLKKKLEKYVVPKRQKLEYRFNKMEEVRSEKQQINEKQQYQFQKRERIPHLKLGKSIDINFFYQGNQFKKEQK